MACLVREESRWGTDIDVPGDNGLAWGYYQIHIDKHPVTKECAMDFECSADYTYKSIDAGYGYWWTPYYRCAAETGQR